MTGGDKPLEPGLYFVSTPIGNARDITLRALDILTAADVLVAEDTRSLRRLMDLHGVRLGDRPIFSYHDHNGDKVRPRILRALGEGQSVAYASEAGTPLIADPGFHLGRVAADAGHLVTAAPGVSAAVTALTVSGLPSDRFLFVGFLSDYGQKTLAELAAVPATLIIYESPRRVEKLVSALEGALGGDRQIVIARELTKKFEEVIRGKISDVSNSLAARALKGEVVVLVDRADSRAPKTEDLESLLAAALERLSLKDAVAEVALVTGLKRRDVYQRALALEKGKNA